MKRFVFSKCFKFTSSLSEWSSSIYVYNKKNLFLENNNKVYDLFYHYFNLNLSFEKMRKRIDIDNLNNNFLNKFIIKKIFFIHNVLHFFKIDNKSYIYFTDNDNIEKKRLKKIIKNFFHISRLFKYRMRKRYTLKLFRNRSMNKIFISRPEIRHSMNEVIITLYIYNREKFFYLKKLSKLNKLFFNLLKENKRKKILLLNELKKVNYSFKYIKNGIVPKLFNSKLLNFKNNLYNLNSYVNTIKNHESTYILLNNNNYVLNNIKKVFNMNLKKIFMYKFYISIIYLNNFKFNNNNLIELKKKLYNIFKKKVNINIINLKYFYLENSIFIDGLINKLNDRKKKVLRVLRRALNLGKIVKLHPLFYRNKKREIKNSVIKLNKLNNNLNRLLYTSKENKYIDIVSYIKNKHVNGIRIEAKGRLTKRLTASRAIYKLNYKGSLKNIYSSYNKLSTIMLRGLHKSNIQYVNTNSKNRNGSYGIKYWLSSY